MFSFPSQNKKSQGYGCRSQYVVRSEANLTFKSTSRSSLHVKYFKGRYPLFDPLSDVFQIWMFLNSEVFKLCTVFGISLGSFFSLCELAVLPLEFDVGWLWNAIMLRHSVDQMFIFTSLVRVVFPISFPLRVSSSLSANIRHELMYANLFISFLDGMCAQSCLSVFFLCFVF